MPRKKAQVEASLKNKGFEQKDGDHHFFVYVTTEGKKTTVRTKTSHTPKMKDIPDNLLAQMAKQCQLSKNDFSRLVDCPLSRESYEDILKNKGIFSE
jgi:predicted RNA binding protein YcfA (HicA-like mRNA interferase family)